MWLYGDSIMSESAIGMKIKDLERFIMWKSTEKISKIPISNIYQCRSQSFWCATSYDVDIVSVHDDFLHINAVDAFDGVDEVMPTKQLDAANLIQIFSSLVTHYLCPCFSMILQNLERAPANRNSMDHLFRYGKK